MQRSRIRNLEERVRELQDTLENEREVARREVNALRRHAIQAFEALRSLNVRINAWARQGPVVYPDYSRSDIVRMLSCEW